MSKKIFQYTVNNNTNTDKGRKNISYIIEKNIRITNEAMDIIEADIMLDNISTENIDDSWKEFCKITGCIHDTNLSTEAIISKKEGTTSLLTRMWHNLTDLKDDIVTVFNTFSGYDSSKLEDMLSDIKTGKLIPKKELGKTDQYRLQDKLATFFVTGNSLKNGSKDLIAYMDEPVENLLKGRYNDFMSKHWKTMWTTNPNDAKRYETINLDFKKFRMPLKIEDDEKNFIIMSFLVKRFYHKLYLYTLYIPSGKKEKRGEESWFSHSYLNNIDILNIQDKYIEEIKPLDTKSTIDLLEYCIKKEKDISKAISESKKLFYLYGVKNNLLKVITGITQITSSAHAVLAGRAFNVFITHLGNVSKDMIYYDKLVLDLIDSMYEKK
ncbi:MAG: hypothetical protein AB7G52_12865 [Arcobacter sp.]